MCWGGQGGGSTRLLDLTCGACWELDVLLLWTRQGPLVQCHNEQWSNVHGCRNCKQIKFDDGSNSRNPSRVCNWRIYIYWRKLEKWWNSLSVHCVWEYATFSGMFCSLGTLTFLIAASQKLCTSAWKFFGGLGGRKYNILHSLFILRVFEKDWNNQDLEFDMGSSHDFTNLKWQYDFSLIDYLHSMTTARWVQQKGNCLQIIVKLKGGSKYVI